MNVSLFLAKAVAEDKTSITCDNMMGTFNFMSPEVIESKTNDSGKARKSVVKKGKGTVAKKQMASDSLIISIRRLDDNKASTSGATERIVTFGNSKDEDQRCK